MKKLLYIGHAYHKKTQSTIFLQELLKTNYEVETFDFDPYVDGYTKFKELEGNKYDVVVLFQIMPEINKLKQFIKFDKFAFFPMYDSGYNLNNPKWNEYKDANIINFSKTLHNSCKEYGLSSYYIQYFPKPQNINDYGDEKSVFLWQRREVINPKTIEKILDTTKINHLYLHQYPDPNEKLIQPSDNWKNKVEISNWFNTKDEMNKTMQKAAIYFAPRKTEGIGMSFLEAMAMGRCVIASNKPTMSEYIKDGYNGFLYKTRTPKKIKIKNVREIQKNTLEYISKGYENWEKEKFKILDWIEANPIENSNQELIDSKITIKQTKKTTITLLQRTYTKKYEILKILGLITIKIKAKRY